MSDPRQPQPLTQHTMLRVRPDLIVHAQNLGGQRCWVVKDPVSLEYYQLGQEEYAILRMLDGQASFEGIVQTFEQTFAPRRLSPSRLQGLLSRFHRQGLVLSDAPGQDAELLERYRRKRRHRIIGRLTSVLAVRFRGVDPERWLAWLYPRLRWIYSPWFLAICSCVVVAALFLVVLQFDQVRARLPAAQAFFALQNVLLLGIALAGTKVLHELGHALTCKHFQGECHEIGFMLLVFTPCLYCNVSDAWMIPNKWGRIAVSAAGIVVEVVLASICTFLWWFSEPGAFHALCLNTMVVCSVSTLLLNGNPLLRYDGYFILSDLLDVPNLWQRSRRLVGALCAGLCLGRPIVAERDLREHRAVLVAGYGIASMVYRLTVVVAILFFLFQMLEPYRLRIVAQAITALTALGLFATPLIGAARFVRDPVARRDMNRWRLAVCCVAAACAGGLLFAVPLPYRVPAAAIVEPFGVRRVYVTVPGSLASTVPTGTAVKVGQPLAHLTNAQLDREVTALETEFERKRLQLEHLAALRSLDPEIGTSIPALREVLEDLATQLAQRREDQQRLVIKAPVAGTVVASPETPRAPSRDELPGRTGSPLEQRNLGCFLETGAAFCWIGDAERREVLLYIDQQHIEYVRIGQPVRIQLASLPGRVLTGEIESLAKVDAESLPPQLARMWSGDKNAAGELTATFQTIYQARASLDRQDSSILIGAAGRAKVQVDPLPLGHRLLRFLSETFAIGYGR